MKIITTSDGGDVEVTIKMWADDFVRNGNQVSASIHAIIIPTVHSETISISYVNDGFAYEEENGWTRIIPAVTYPAYSTGPKYQYTLQSNSYTWTWTIDDNTKNLTYTMGFRWEENVDTRTFINLTESIPISILGTLAPQQLYKATTGTCYYMDSNDWFHYDAGVDNVNLFRGLRNNRIQSNTDYLAIIEIDEINNTNIQIQNNSQCQLIPTNGTTILDSVGFFTIPCSAAQNGAGRNYLLYVSLSKKDSSITENNSAKFRISIVEDTTITEQTFVYQPYIETETIIKKVKSAFGNEAKIGTEAQYVTIGNGHSLQYWLDETPSILGGVTVPTSNIGKNGDIYIQYEDDE